MAKTITAAAEWFWTLYPFFTYFGLVWAVGIWSRRWGRNSVAWTIFAFFFLPMAVGCLAACGKVAESAIPQPPKKTWWDIDPELPPPPTPPPALMPLPKTKVIIPSAIKERAAKGDHAAIEQIRETERFNGS